MRVLNKSQRRGSRGTNRGRGPTTVPCSVCGALAADDPCSDECGLDLVDHEHDAELAYEETE